MELPTIKIKTEYGRGWAIINASDFDTAKHVAFDDAPPFKPLPELSNDKRTSEPMSDDDLRAAIEAATGKAPHHKTGRAKLIDLYTEAVK